MSKLYTHNPILPAEIFVPDVEAHVWEDGRLYFYGSLDLEGTPRYCSDRYHVYSTDDLVHWVDHGVSFTTKDVTWEENITEFYAPDCAYRNGKYYLYYCIPDGRCGVAVADKPYGPFVDVGQIQNVWGIDPAVFIDYDGQAYLYWGQFDWVRVAKLKENMVEIEADSAIQPLSVAEHEFHEGSSVKKIHGKYYYLFTDTHRHAELNGGKGMATCLGYAISDHPMHGFQYKGVIIDNLGCDPKTWNNHGSMVCFKGQWYLCYHRSTHCSKFSRHVCMEPITFEEDGSIKEIKMTTSGPEASIPAGVKIPASWACQLSGKAYISGDVDSAHHLALCNIHPGDSAVFRYLSFNGEDTFTVKIRSSDSCKVKLKIDGKQHSSIEVGASDSYTEHTSPIPAIDGVHELTLCFSGDFGTASLDEIAFGAGGKE